MFSRNRDVLHSSTAGLLTPNLQEVAKNADESDDEVCKLAGLVLALTVQVRQPIFQCGCSASSESDPSPWFTSCCCAVRQETAAHHAHPKPRRMDPARIDVLDRAGALRCASPAHGQACTLTASSRSQVMSKVRPADIREEGEDEEVECVCSLCWSKRCLTRYRRAPRSDFYEIRHEKSRIMHDKEALQVMYEDLLEQFNSLKDQHVRVLSLSLPLFVSFAY